MLTKKEKMGLLVIFLSLMGFAFSANTIPPLATTIAKDISCRYEAFGYIFTIQFLAFALASLLGGWVTGRFGLSNKFLVTCGIFTLSATLLAGSLIPSIGWFIVWAVPLGLAGGLVETFSAILVTRFGKNHSSKLMNLSQIFFCLGAIAAPQIIAIMLGAGLSWKIAFISFGILIAVIGAAFSIFMRGINEPAIEIASAEISSPPQSIRFTPIYRDTFFYVLSAAIFFYVCIECSIVCWIAAYFEKFMGITASSSAWRLGIYWTGIILGRSLMLVLPGKWTIWPALIICSTLMIAGAILMIPHWNPITATIFIGLAGLAAGPIWPIIITVSQKERLSSQFTSGVIAVGAIGAATGPFISSLIIKSHGMHALFPSLATGGTLLLISVLLSYRAKSPTVKSV